ncbi:hypothetical protein AB2M62_18990 [Sphingomonas sp. MMS12-HWE2-04]|uniref:hypothetical protein n=1 Tax=Sphingomonas sp. MMS12-HWE2-04 TaxID=3234199 RepID=UPI00385160AF
MRLILAGALLALAPAPAFADVTARYAIGSQTLTVEVDDSGDYRAELSGKFAVIRHGGDEFVVITHNGKAFAAKADVFLPLLKAKMAQNAAPPGGPGATLAFTTRQGNDETVAGRKGSSWRITAEAPGSNVLILVMSADAQLAPVGGVFRHVVTLALDAFAPVFENNASFRDQLTAVFAKGTPLTITGPATIELAGVSAESIADSRFASPTILLDAKALDAALSEPTATPGEP